MDKIVTTFYKFVPLADLPELRHQLIKFCTDNEILGTILIAPEGINGTVFGLPDFVTLFQNFMRALPEFTDIDFKDSKTHIKAFDRLKVKIKEEIITFKVPVDVKQHKGEYLDADAWDKMMANGDTILIDTRNNYEYALGTFRGAINPKTANFTDLPAWVDENLKEEDKNKNILMFCTGGVRCEKSTALLKQNGFNKVYHLEGGIIKYLQKKQNKSHNWEGSCFVFDNRVVVREDTV